MDKFVITSFFGVCIAYIADALKNPVNDEPDVIFLQDCIL